MIYLNIYKIDIIWYVVANATTYHISVYNTIHVLNYILLTCKETINNQSIGGKENERKNQ